MSYLDRIVITPRQAGLGSAIRPAAERLLVASALLLQQEQKAMLLLERDEVGQICDLICHHGRQSELDSSNKGLQPVIQMVHRYGAELLDTLGQVWPNYAAPESLGVLTDGQDIYFSPDSPSVMDKDWFLYAARGEIRVCSLLGRNTPLSRLLAPEKTAIFH